MCHFTKLNFHRTLVMSGDFPEMRNNRLTMNVMFMVSVCNSPPSPFCLRLSHYLQYLISIAEIWEFSDFLFGEASTFCCC